VEFFACSDFREPRPPAPGSWRGLLGRSGSQPASHQPSMAVLLSAATVATVLLRAVAAEGRTVATRPFPSMVFMENNTADGPKREGLNFTIEQEHARQLLIASSYQLVIMGWGEDQMPGQQGGEEAKLATILSAIKAKSPATKTFAYCGQFEGERIPLSPFPPPPNMPCP
jgi:hypothetical protein